MKKKLYYRGSEYNPEIKKLLNELHELRGSADSLANLITSSFYAHETEEEQTLRREKAAATRDAYDYVILRLKYLNYKI